MLHVIIKIVSDLTTYMDKQNNFVSKIKKYIPHSVLIAGSSWKRNLNLLRTEGET